MAESKTDKFFEGLGKAMKIGGFTLIFFLIVRSLEGRRFMRQLQRLTGGVLNRTTIEGKEGYKRILEWGAGERDRILSTGVSATIVTFAFGTLCIIASALIPLLFIHDGQSPEARLAAVKLGAMVEGLVTTVLLFGMIILVHAILATILPIWALVSAIVGAVQKAGEGEISAEGVKKAPAWFVGMLTSAGSETIEQVGALYRWFTRLTGWLAFAAAYMWIVSFHNTPSLLAGLALPIITTFYAFNQGWRADKQYLERGPVWKAVVISTALVMLYMAFLATFPRLYDLLLLGDTMALIIFWVIVATHLVVVYKWSTSDKTIVIKPRGGSSGSGRLKDRVASLVVLGLVILGIFFMRYRYELDLRHTPVQIVMNELIKHNALFPQLTLTPSRVNGSLQYTWGFKTEQRQGEGSWRYPDTVARLTSLGSNPDSFLVTVNPRTPGWQLIARTVKRGDVINYHTLTTTYAADTSGVRIQVPLDGFRRADDQVVMPNEQWVTDRYCLTANAPYASLVMRVGAEGRPQAMAIPDGSLRLTRRLLSPRSHQRLALGFNLVQDQAALRQIVSSEVQVVIWIDRQKA